MNQRVAILTSVLLLSTPGIALAETLPGNQKETDVPEEILQTEVITNARSPIDNQPLNATEYAELQTQIKQANEVPPKLSSKVRNTVALLKLRKFIKTVLPFIPIK